MKLVSFEHAKRPGFGAIAEDGGIIDLTIGLGTVSRPSSRRSLQMHWKGFARLRPGARSELIFDEVRLLPGRFRNRERFICIGAAYRNAKHKDGSVPLPRYPSIFLVFPDPSPAIVKISRSRRSPFNWTDEGRDWHRDRQRRSPHRRTGCGKSYRRSDRDERRHGTRLAQARQLRSARQKFRCVGACGPWLVTSDEFKGYDDIRVTTKVNGNCPSGRHHREPDFFVPANHQLSVAVDHARTG